MSKKTLLRHYRDFDYAEAQYRTNTKTIKEIADEIGITRAALFDYISKNNVTRDLGAAIKNRTMEMLAGDIIDSNGRLPTKQEDLIQINATLQAAVIRSHRGDIDRFRRLAMALLSELEGMTVYQDTLEDIGTILRSEDKNGTDKLNDVYKRVISLPGRTDTLKKLGDTLKTLILLERQAFGMREDYEDEDIRRAKITSDPGKPVTSFDSITTRFMKVLGVTDVQPTE
jgi:predicted transcriptional regulator